MKSDTGLEHISDLWCGMLNSLPWIPISLTAEWSEARFSCKRINVFVKANIKCAVDIVISCPFKIIVLSTVNNVRDNAMSSYIQCNKSSFYCGLYYYIQMESCLRTTLTVDISIESMSLINSLIFYLHEDGETLSMRFKTKLI